MPSNQIINDYFNHEISKGESQKQAIKVTAKTYTIMEESADEHDNEPLNKQQYMQPTVTE